MAKPLQLVGYDDDSVDVAYLWGNCRGTFRDCPQKGTDVDMLLLALQISGLEYVDPLVTDGGYSLIQMLQNGTADLDLITAATTHYGYELFAYTGAVDKECFYFSMSLQEPIVYTEFLLDTFPWIYYIYLALGIAAISTILTISQRESTRSMLVEWPLRLLAVVLRQPALDHFAKHARLSGLVAAAASLLPFTIFAMYFELNIKLLLTVPFQYQPPLIHAMKHGGYEFVRQQDGYWPVNYATPKQKTELEALADRFVTYPDTGLGDLDRSVSDPALKRVSMKSASWSTGHCADVLITNTESFYLLVMAKDITPYYTAYPMRRELYKERERLNRALALIQLASINFPLKLVLVFFGAIYLGCILVFFLEIIVRKMVHRLHMWHTLGTAQI